MSATSPSNSYDQTRAYNNDWLIQSKIDSTQFISGRPINILASWQVNNGLKGTLLRWIINIDEG
ncbi:hypothetical protein N7453_002483 [Penicillium expansum]|nr:hypothetical protein N7453_002483 [Penicillium expansum]